MTDAAATLFTVGYEARTQAEFLDVLAAAGVARIIDVRAVAASRRPGFSKTGLAALAERGIDYLHLRALGTPKEGREAARRGDTPRMLAIYAEQLATPEAALALEQARGAVAERPSALLCFEREATHCHRAAVADLLVPPGTGRVVDL
ncbi:MAG TPA: DUF488 domain-containing protein [Sphingomonadaceae bacterium]|nr:DUF488 domain-containing protein [Sphingomonadaceae bacterium]